MPFHLTDEQEMIQRVVRELVEKDVAPHATSVDRERRVPKEALQAVSGLGLLGVLLPPEQGGAGGDTVTYCLAVDEVSRGCASSGLLLATGAMVSLLVARTASEETRTEWLPKLASGGSLGAYAITEPDAGLGGEMLTKARKDGDEWVVSGHKSFVTGATIAGAFAVLARTPDGPTAFLVPANASGVRIGTPERMLGLHGTQVSHVRFVDVRTPHILGEPGQGWTAIRDPLDVYRLGVASIAGGCARAALDASKAYAQQREQFDEPIKAFQAIRDKLARMVLGTEAVHLLTWSAADTRDRGRDFHRAAALAKWYASETVPELCRQAIRLHGGAGYMRELPVERYYRDARCLRPLGAPDPVVRDEVVDDLYS